MINNYQGSKRVYQKEFRLEFTDKNGCGASFPCNEKGELLKDEINPEAYKTLEWCLAHPEAYEVFNKVVEYKNSYKEPPSGTCHCGEQVYLYGSYMGATQCPRCGQWYNVFGEELLPPEEWEEDY